MRKILMMLSFLFSFGISASLCAVVNAEIYQPMDGMDNITYPTVQVEQEEKQDSIMSDSVQATSYPYLIKVNKKMNTITIYAKNSEGDYTKPVKAMVCSTGSATPVGTFKTPAKYRWATLMGPSYGQYSTRIYKGFLFHSVWYYRNGDKSSQSYAQYNKLGTTASHGCVRLTVADAKWIYDNCPLGTTVVIYNSSYAGPLGKPTAIKVSTTQKMGWDPTDPDPANPYKKTPTITISSKKKSEIKKGSTFNALQYVTAKDGFGNDITSSIKVTGSVDTSKVGVYTLKYKVTDKYGNSATKKFKVSVLTSYPTFKGGKDVTVGMNSTYNVKENVKAADRDGTDITEKIKISVVDPDGNAVGLTDGAKLFCEKTGVYKVTYQVTGDSGRSTKKTRKITVQDRRVKLEVSNKTVKAGETSDIYLGIDSLKNYKGETLSIDSTNVSVKGKSKLKLDTPGKYKLTYVAKEGKYKSRKVEKSVVITVTE